MCHERGRNNNVISQQLIQAWYMKHVFQDFRGSWPCISFARTKTKTNAAYQSQADMARSMNLQRASARAAATRRKIHFPSLGCTETSQWMFRTFTSLYSKKKSRTKDPRLSTRLKSLIRSSSFDRNEDPISSSSLADLIPSGGDFDLGTFAMSPDSDFLTADETPSRRSSDSFFSPQTCDSSGRAAGSACPKSPFRTGRHHRRKRSIFRAAKVALTGGRGRNAAGMILQALPPTPASSGIGSGRSKYSLKGAMMTPTRMMDNQHPPSPASAFVLEKNLSRATTVTMDTSSSPCQSSAMSSWLDNYDMLTDTFLMDSPLPETKHDTSNDTPREAKLSCEEWRPALHEDDNKQEYYWFDYSRDNSGPVGALPVSRDDIQKRQAWAIDEVRHTGKDFQDAIVDIILDNDVNDLVDLEEFLRGYFRLNALYQDIIQQFFNDLSDDLVNTKLSRAPSIFARLAAANEKSMMMAATMAGCRTREF